MPPTAHPLVEIRRDPVKGRGVFATGTIAAGTVIEEAPVIVMSAQDCAAADRTILYEYYFHWDGDPEGEGRGAIGLGLVTLCNHSPRPKALVRRNLDRDTLSLLALAPIEAGEEITIDYNCTLWFAPQD